MQQGLPPAIKEPIFPNEKSGPVASTWEWKREWELRQPPEIFRGRCAAGEMYPPLDLLFFFKYIFVVGSFGPVRCF